MESGPAAAGTGGPARGWGKGERSWRKEDINLIVGLDIGTSKVVVVVGEVHADGHINVVGFGSQPSRGLKGVVVNIEATVQSIQRAVAEAEAMAGCRNRSVCRHFEAGHIHGLNSMA